jgi:aryl-alcohol dehydrogenase-like predicted oxidoreductase
LKDTTVGRTGLRQSDLVLGAMTFGEQGGVGSSADIGTADSVGGLATDQQQ